MSFFNFIPVLIVALYQAGPAIADDTYPLKCCPQSCLPVEDADISDLRSDGMPREFRSKTFGQLSIPADLAPEYSSDGMVHICVGYDPFGDPQVKCVLIPTVTM